MSMERETNEHLFDMLANINSDFYAENKALDMFLGSPLALS